jgi:uncharacterized protein (TIGR00255 family)
MTGFGKAEIKTRVGTFMVEMSSVNNRFLEVHVRQPRQFASLEPKTRSLVSSTLMRGKVNVFLSFEEPDGGARKYPINVDAARAYHKRLKSLQKDLKLSGEISLQDLLALPEVASSPAQHIDDSLYWPHIEKTVKKALNELVSMRRREGSAIKKDMTARFKTLADLTKRVVRDADGVTDRYREKLNKRITDLLNGHTPDPLRLEEEITLVADRADITEECTRLFSHLDQGRRTIAKKGPVGKKLNFILQELNREANTIASKCTEIDINRTAIAIKEEIEKLREQIQNIE